MHNKFILLCIKDKIYFCPSFKERFYCMISYVHISSFQCCDGMLFTLDNLVFLYRGIVCKIFIPCKNHAKCNKWVESLHIIFKVGYKECWNLCTLDSLIFVGTNFRGLLKTCLFMDM